VFISTLNQIFLMIVLSIVLLSPAVRAGEIALPDERVSKNQLKEIYYKKIRDGLQGILLADSDADRFRNTLVFTSFMSILIANLVDNKQFWRKHLFTYHLRIALLSSSRC
jgi:hypothetical protein